MPVYLSPLPAARPVTASHPIFSQRKFVILLATLCCLLWGSAYPSIKAGYALFAIAADDLPSKLLFAGYRFLAAGLLILAAAAPSRRIFALDAQQWRQIALLGFTQTTLQYVFFYVGLAYTTGVKGSIMNATGSFFSVLIAHFIYHNDRLSLNKVLGCLAGFAGVMVVNFGHSLLDFDFTLRGEGCVTVAAFMLSAAAIYGKKLSQRIDSFVLTGHQLAFGGLILVLLGHAGGGTLSGFTVASTALFAYLALLSSIAFALWTCLLKYNSVGMVSMFNFLIPVFGALLSAIFLGESILEWKYMLALLLVCAGIWHVARAR